MELIKKRKLFSDFFVDFRIVFSLFLITFAGSKQKIFTQNSRNGGNDLATEQCPKGAFSCRFPAFFD
jgi:hypothetical protein